MSKKNVETKKAYLVIGFTNDRYDGQRFNIAIQMASSTEDAAKRARNHMTYGDYREVAYVQEWTGNDAQIDCALDSAIGPCLKATGKYDIDKTVSEWID